MYKYWEVLIGVQHQARTFIKSPAAKQTWCSVSANIFSANESNDKHGYLTMLLDKFSWNKVYVPWHQVKMLPFHRCHDINLALLRSRNGDLEPGLYSFNSLNTGALSKHGTMQNIVLISDHPTKAGFPQSGLLVHTYLNVLELFCALCNK